MQTEIRAIRSRIMKEFDAAGQLASDSLVDGLVNAFLELTRQPTVSRKSAGPLGDGGRILLEKLQDARFKVGYGRTPKGFATHEQAQRVEDAYTALGMNGQFSASIDYALGQGITDLARIVNMVCKRAVSASKVKKSAGPVGEGVRSMPAFVATTLRVEEIKHGD